MYRPQTPFLVCLFVCAVVVNCNGSGQGHVANSAPGGNSGTGGGSALGGNLFRGGASAAGGSTATHAFAMGGASVGGTLATLGGATHATSSEPRSSGNGQGGNSTVSNTPSGAPGAGGATALATRGGTAGKSSIVGGTAGGTDGSLTGCVAPVSYRNLFVESLGKTQDEVDAKLNKLVQQLFHGTDDQKIYYELGDKAQIYDTGNGDVRSEGQSYGMMMAVQMDMRTEFDKLWNYAASCMRQTNGSFTWSMQQGSCSAKQAGFAPDGEEYFAMALILASRRWDTSTGIDYASEAKKVLKTLAGKDYFNKSPACVFYTQNSGNSDPSYVLPLFYSQWACFDSDNVALWDAAATHARKTFFHNACNKQTGLASERAALDGTPQDDFGPDSWRVPMNIMMDYNLINADRDWQMSYAKTHAAFWVKEGLTTYGDRYSLSGEKKDPNHGPGQDSVNAMLALALPDGDANAKALLERAWEVPMQVGQYRYYNGCLQVLAFLHTSGRFRLFW